MDNTLTFVNKLLKAKKSADPKVNEITDKICAEFLLQDQAVADRFRAALEAKFA